MNTELETPKSKDIEVLTEISKPSSLDVSAAALEQQLQNEQDKRREERFFWIFMTTILIDILALRDVDAALIVFIALLEIAFLLGLAKWFGIEHIAVPLERLFDKYLRDSNEIHKGDH
jgi:hypothetical protein